MKKTARFLIQSQNRHFTITPTSFGQEKKGAKEYFEVNRTSKGKSTTPYEEREYRLQDNPAIVGNVYYFFDYAGHKYKKIIFNTKSGRMEQKWEYIRGKWKRTFAED